MVLIRFLIALVAFIGALAAAGALVLSIVLMLRFPALLVVVLLAFWFLNRLFKVLSTPTWNNPTKDTAT